MTKRVVILHSMEQTSKGHWYPWLKSELEKRGYKVWVPDLPNTAYPSVVEAKQLLLSSGWDFQDSLVIGHSSGTLQLLYLLQNLPKDVKVNSAVLVSTFDHPLPGMEAQHEKLFTEEYQSEEIKKHVKNLIFLHAEDDPWCPLSGPQNWRKKLGGELVVLEEGGHFSTSLDPRFTEFPELVSILEERKLI